MNRRFVFLLLLVAGAMLLPFRSPAPLYYTPGEGWYYEPYGEKADWQRPRAKDQLDVAEQAFTNKNYNVTLHAAHRIVRVWPLSDYAPRAEYLIGRCLEVDAQGRGGVQRLPGHHPKISAQRQLRGRAVAAIRNRQPFSRRRMVPAVGHHPALPLDGRDGASCSARSSPTALTATSRRTRNCTSARRARSRRITTRR